MNHCTLSPILSLLWKKWSTHIMATFCKREVMSFWEIYREFPNLTPTTITRRLKEFQVFDLIEKREDGKYQSTEKMWKISLLLQQLDI